jgi:hypothetical protein
MALVERIDPKPIEPTYRIELTAKEARGLLELLRSGISGHTLDLLHLEDLEIGLRGAGVVPVLLSKDFRNTASLYKD